MSSPDPDKKGRRASILEGHKTPREHWLWAVGEVRRMVKEMRIMCASGQRFLALVRILKEQVKAQKNGSLGLALASATAGTTADNSEEDAKTISLTSAAKRVIQRTDTGRRTDAQCDVILKAFPIIAEVSGSEEAAHALCQLLRFRTIKAQKVLVKQGLLGKSLIAVLRGSLRVIVRADTEPLHKGDANIGTTISVLKSGDLLLRRLRSISYFETFAYATVGRDIVDDMMCEIAYVEEPEYSEMLMTTRIAMSTAMGEKAMERRRSNLLGARNALRKKGEPVKKKKSLKGLLGKAVKITAKVKRQVEGKMTISDAMEFKISEKDKVRITMAKQPERRTVEELEFVIEYLERCGFWDKVADVKSSDEGRGRKSEGGGVANLAGDSEGNLGNDESASGLTPRLQREIVKQLRTLVFGKNEVVFEEGAHGTYFFYVLTGSVVVRKREGTRSRNLCTLATGSCFGELALSKMGNGRRTASIVTRELCEFLVLPKALYTASLESFQEKHLAHRLELLGESRMFSERPWNLRDLKSLCYPLEEELHPMDIMLCRQGRFANHVYILQRGECSVFKNVKFQGGVTTMSLGRLSRGDVFGLMGAGGETYLQNMRYSVSVVSATPVTLMSLTRYDVFNRIRPAVKDELQARALHQKWNDEKSLLKRLVNRERFMDFREHRLDTILPPKYRERKEKAKEETALKLSRTSGEQRRRHQRRKKRLLAQGKNRLPKIQTHFERNLPPSRQCSRKAMVVAAENGPLLVLALSPTGGSPPGSPPQKDPPGVSESAVVRVEDEADALVGAGMMPVHKPLTLPEKLLGKKIDRWVQNRTGADILF